MPALAVTEHGNMFSTIVFHDAARKKGIKPIIGCEVYVAPGRPADEERHARRDRQPPGAAGRERTRATTTSSSWCRPATRRASTTSRASTRSCWPQHARGLIGLSSCLKGEVADGHPHGAGTARACRRPPRTATSSGAGNFFLEMQYQGIEEQRKVNQGLVPIARDLGLPLVCTNDVHYLRQDDHKPHDILLCIGTGKTVNDEQRLRYHGDQFYLKTPEEMRASSASSPTRSPTRCGSPSAARSTSTERCTTCRTSRCPAGFTPRRLLRARRRGRDSTCACRGCASWPSRAC